MRELAQAQATTGNVLSELGGRLSSTAGPNWPSQTSAGSTSPGELLLSEGNWFVSIARRMRVLGMHAGLGAFGAGKSDICGCCMHASCMT